MSIRSRSLSPQAIGSTQVGYSITTVEKVYDNEQSVVLPTAPHLSIINKLAYGVGHVFNDLCASMWFTYLVLFYHNVALLDNLYAGMLILIGQVADAAATPIIGFLCDKTHVRYGRRKLWHLIGTIMVSISLFFIWHTCLGCSNSLLAVKIVYFSIPIIIFQFGWASVQISHLSLIPELTQDKNERVGLNAIRYSFTILANIGVYVVMFLLLKFVSSGSHTAAVTSLNVWTIKSQSNSTDEHISPSDVWIFSGTALGIIFVGVCFSAIFQIGTREPYIPPEQRQNQYNEGIKIKWYLWFTKPKFYLVAVIYMCTRLMNNITQAYTPLFLVDTLMLSKISVAIGPLVIFLSGFITTLILKFLNKVIGRYMVYLLGLTLMSGGLIWFWFTSVPGESIPSNIVLYGATVFVGAGGAAVLVTSLSMVADLIDNATGSSAFVYGLMSFTDKLSSGVVIQIIQALHPCKNDVICCPECAPYYRKIIVFVPGAAVGIATISLVFLSLLICYGKYRNKKEVHLKNSQSQEQVTSINTNIRDSAERSTSPLRLPVQDDLSTDGEKKPLLHS